MFYTAVKIENRNKTTPVGSVPVVVEEAIESSSSKSNTSKTMRAEMGGLHNGYRMIN